MQFDNLWQQLDRLLSVDKNARTRTEADEITLHLKTLVASPEGRSSIVQRLQLKGPFPGKERFLRELARGLDEFRPNETDSAAKERRELLRLGVSKSSGRKIEGHWDLLWLLVDSDDPDSAEIALISLMKVLPKKQSDLRDSLASLDSWQQTRPDRGVAILEAVQSKTIPPDFVERLERALTWQKGRVHQRAVGESDHTHSKETVAAPNSSVTKSASAVIADPVDERAVRPTSIPTEKAPIVAEKPATLILPVNEKEVSGGDVIPAAREAVVKKSRTATPRNEDATRDPLEACISEVNSVITSCFRKYADRANAATEGVAQTLQDVTLLSGQCNQLSEELSSVRGELQQEIEISRESRKRVTQLEHELSLREDEMRATRNEVSKLMEAVASARQEVQQVHDRADDDIHQIKLERDHAIRTFQSELWERLKLCLAEVLNEGDVNTSLTSDDHFFRRRLREIRAVLQEMQVPPY